MKIIYDPQKSTLNLDKHGVSLELANAIDWDFALVKPDTRKDYGESRMIGYAPIQDRLYNIVFVDRGAYRRIISLRKANSREVEYYESQT
jgi:uncharacterized protein